MYGTLGPGDAPFSETTPYAPNSPYSASKAASDHLVRAYHHTYGLPTLTTNCSNNYGPYHFPEKLIPLVILNALDGKPLPIYGDGQQIRDWLFVSDHCTAIREVLTRGVPGETYNVGGWNEKQISTWCRRCATSSTNSNPRPPAATATRSLSCKTAPATTAATPLTPASWSANWAGNLPRRSKPASPRPYAGTSAIRNGSPTCARAVI